MYKNPISASYKNDGLKRFTLRFSSDFINVDDPGKKYSCVLSKAIKPY